MAEEVTPNEIEETTTVQEQVKTEDKKFSQKELDLMIQSRIKREKESFNSAKSSWDSEKQEYDSKLSKYEEHLQSMINLQANSLTEGERKLLAKLPVLDQIEYLADLGKEEKVKTKIPQTPKPTEKKVEEKKENRKYPVNF